MGEWEMGESGGRESERWERVRERKMGESERTEDGREW